MQNISFIICNYNTKNYTEWCYNSIRKNLSNNHEIVFINDGSTDETHQYLDYLLMIDDKIIVHHNQENLGIAYSYNKAVELASNEIICVIHSDMYIPPKFDEIMTSLLNKYDIVCSHRIEPNVYPTGFDKMIIDDLGNTLETFNEQLFLDTYKYNLNINCVNHGFSFDDIENNMINIGQKTLVFPWITTKKVYNSVNGQDLLFSKYMVEDNDFYFRLVKSGYTYFQTFETSVFHMASRSSRFANDKIELKNGDDKWNEQNNKSTRNFIRKWGFHQSIIFNQDGSINSNLNKYKTHLIIESLNNDQVLYFLEPFFDYITIINDDTHYHKYTYIYLSTVQSNTKINIKKKLIDLKDINKTESSIYIKVTHKVDFKLLFQFLYSGKLYTDIINKSGNTFTIDNDNIIIEIANRNPIINLKSLFN